MLCQFISLGKVLSSYWVLGSGNTQGTKPAFMVFTLSEGKGRQGVKTSKIWKWKIK